MSQAKQSFLAASSPYITLNEIAAMIGLRGSLPVAVDKKLATELIAKSHEGMRESLALLPMEGGFRLEIHASGADKNPIMSIGFEEEGPERYTIGVIHVSAITDDFLHRPVLQCEMIDNVANLILRERELFKSVTSPRSGPALG